MRFLNLFRRAKLDREMSAELSHHLESLAEEYQSRGMSPEEARFAAKRDLGSLALTQEQYREQRGVPWLEAAGRELRMAGRSILRGPGLSIAIIFTLALGIGANTAIFDVVQAVLFQPLPYPNPDRLVWVEVKGAQDEVSRWRHATQAFDSVTPIGRRESIALDGIVPLEIHDLQVSEPLTRLLGVKMALGRDFIDEEIAQPRRGDAVIITYRLFQERFAGDPQVLGSNVTVGYQKHVIVGVLSPDFRLPLPLKDRNVEPDVIFNYGTTSGFDSFGQLIGRLKPNVTLRAAESELAGMFKDPKNGVHIVTLQEHIVGRTRTELLVLWFTASAVLLIACVNVANLLLARSAARARELGVRAALGASRGALIRQTVAETTLLSFIGGAVGLALASILVAVIADKGPVDVPRLREVTLDWWAVSYCAACCVVTGLITGLGPALAATRRDLLQVLRRGEHNNSVSRKTRTWHRGLAAGQISIALVLLLGAGLLIKTLWVLRSASAGVEPEHILISRIEPTKNYGRLDTKNYEQEVLRRADLRAQEVTDLAHQVGYIPGVRQVSLSMPVSIYTLGTSVEGAPVNWQVPPTYPWLFVSPEYFSTAGYRVIAGRLFNERDVRNSPPVIVVNEAFVRVYAPGLNARDVLNRQARFPTPKSAQPMIVGVVHDLSLRRDIAPEPQIFWPMRQQTMFNSSLELIVRAAGDPTPLTGAIRRLADAASIRMFEAETLEARISAAVATRVFESQLLSAFAAIALLLAIIGVYGVLSYSVTQRTQEIGVRMALGAERRDVLWAVLRDGLLLGIGGAGVGLLGAFALTRWMSSMLYGVQANDPWILSGGTVLMFAVALAAAYIPARRATRVDPIVALRQE